MKFKKRWIIVGVAGWVLVSTAIGTFLASEKHPRASDIEANTQHAQRVSAGVLAASKLRELARDPDSVMIDYLATDQQGKFVCLEYRARNGFGGMNREQSVFLAGKFVKTKSAWDSHCLDGNFDVLGDVTNFTK